MTVTPSSSWTRTTRQGGRRYSSCWSRPASVPYTIGSQQCVSTRVPQTGTRPGTRFLTRVQLHLRLQGMGHELYRSADFLPVQIYIYTKVTLPFPSVSQNGCQIRSHQKLCFGSTRDKPNMTSCHTQREHRSSILISLIMQQRLV
jgi:hypothetical protein